MKDLNIKDELRKKAYLKGKSLCFSKFEPAFPADHTFCVFCWARISALEEDFHDGYLERESQSWVCEICMEDYEQAFSWKVENTNENAWQRLLHSNDFDIDLI